MYKRIIVISLSMVIGFVVMLWGNEFTKPSRKEKVKQDAAYESCMRTMDLLLERVYIVQQQLNIMGLRLYKTVRSCALDDKPVLLDREAPVLNRLAEALQALNKQLQIVETMLGDDKNMALLHS